MSTPTSSKPAESATFEELDAIVQRTKPSVLDPEQHEKLKAAMKTFEVMATELAGKKASIKRLRKLLFGPKSERSSEILGASGGRSDGDEGEANSGHGAESQAGSKKPKRKRKGHGRKSADDYTGAERIHIQHPSLKSGDPCPDSLCREQGGKVYPLKDPKQLVRIIGQAALFAVIYLLERLRCNLCGRIYTAEPPEEVGEGKYDVTAVSMMAILRYGAGLPLHRLERLQGDLGVPLPASTQWEVVSQAEEIFKPVYQALIHEAAQGKILHNDDTGMVILQYLKENRERVERGEARGRTGVFTTGIVAVKDDARIALFFTGRNHAGENLAKVLEKREEELGPAIQMCDALSRNVSGDFKTILCNCMAHSRRQYVDVIEDFPEECRFVVRTLREVFKSDARARSLGMTDEERLELHRKESKRRMASLRLWMWQQFKERRVEPNSGLGQAIRYMQKHWRKLTRFLFIPGAPLENNVVERALKKAICHRRNSLFYKTENGARVGDLCMSLIATCQLSGVNPFDYLTELQKHKDEVKENPGEWLPWNYRAALERVQPPPEG